jgi:hypothetical protein
MANKQPRQTSWTFLHLPLIILDKASLQAISNDTRTTVGSC